VQKPGKVLYLQEEDGLAIVMDRLAIINESKAPETFWHGQIERREADGDGVVLDPAEIWWVPPTQVLPIAMQIKTGFISSDPSWQSWLDDTLTADKFDLVIIDTMGTTQGDIDPNDAVQLMERVLKPLKQLAGKHDAAIMVVHHNKKASNQGGRAGNDMLGSVALHAWVDCAIYARTKDTSGAIEVEREAKMASDIKLRIKIPHMFSNLETGERVLWDPEIMLEGLDEVQRPDEFVAPVQQESYTRQSRGQGSDFTFRLKQMRRRRGSTVADICETLDWEEDRVVRELTKAISKGQVEEVTDGFYKAIL
jgi:hypothetical protein